MARTKKVAPSRHNDTYPTTVSEVPAQQYERYDGYKPYIPLPIESISSVALNLDTRQLLLLPKWSGLQTGRHYITFDGSDEITYFLQQLRILSTQLYPAPAATFWSAVDTLLRGGKVIDVVLECQSTLRFTAPGKKACRVLLLDDILQTAHAGASVWGITQTVQWSERILLKEQARS